MLWSTYNKSLLKRSIHKKVYGSGSVLYYEFYIRGSSGWQYKKDTRNSPSTLTHIKKKNGKFRGHFKETACARERDINMQYMYTQF